MSDAERMWKNLLGQIPPTDHQFKLERSRIQVAANMGSPTGISGVSIGIDDFESKVDAIKAGGVKVTRIGDRAEIDPVDAAGARIALVKAG